MHFYVSDKNINFIRVNILKYIKIIELKISLLMNGSAHTTQIIELQLASFVYCYIFNLKHREC